MGKKLRHSAMVSPTVQWGPEPSESGCRVGALNPTPQVTLSWKMSSVNVC